MKILKTIKHDYVEILPPTIFFFIAFCLILVTKRLILREYGISWTGFGAAIVGAIMVGKVVLIVDKLPFVNKFPDHPLIYNTSWKSLIYFLAALLVRYLEHVVSFLSKHEGFMEANRHLVGEIVWPQFWLIQMWLAVLFFIYCAMRELVRVIGRDRVIHMFFVGRSNAGQIAETTTPNLR
ncbi:MAG: hypothetical protein HY881_28620 [Deltaproteobacteria bacterium]|nr:hypothetical protein [Deltaproteobacteria bacterium]